MAHQIESMFSVKATPWHKLGTVVGAAPTAADAIKLAGLDWAVRTEPLYLADGRRVGANAVVRALAGSNDSCATGTASGRSGSAMRDRSGGSGSVAIGHAG